MKLLITGISAVTGTCFAVLAGLSLAAIVFPARRFHPASVFIAAVAIWFAYLAFRAAVAGRVDQPTLVAALQRGIIAAFLGVVVIAALLLLFGPSTRGFIAHGFSKPMSGFTNLRLMVAVALLAFGTGFVVRMPKGQ